MSALPSTAGELLRDWRKRRRLSQLDFATEADVSQRHLSFLESGRARPSREMVLRLAEHLAIPLRERNALLVAAGYAPLYTARPLDDAALKAARTAVEAILEGHAPHPALAFDRHWNLLFANAAASALMTGIAPALLEPPINILRLSLHPDGLAPKIGNYREWRMHICNRLGQQIEISADPVLIDLLEEFKGYPVPPGAKPYNPVQQSTGIAVSLELLSETGKLRFLSTTTVFGTALDITLSELAIESLFPADQETAAAMRLLAENSTA